jgi:replicative DNA helicase
MSKAELIAKSLSRETLDISKNKREAKTVRGITDGARYDKYTKQEIEVLQNAITAYQSYAKNIYMIEGIGDVTTEKIRERIQKHINTTKKIPIVIIDYLQIIASLDSRLSDKQATDKAVLELKRISRDYKLTVIAISSFNRANYSEAVTMQAFKESGAIEYSSDVLIGLQAKGAGTKDFDIDSEKNRDPRTIELKILKNRNGRTGATIDFFYYPLFNQFEEA